MTRSRVTHPPNDVRGENFRVLIEGFGVGTWDLDLNTRELNWFETAGSLLGVARGQPGSYDLFMSRPEPGDRERVETAIKRVCERGGGLACLSGSQANQRVGNGSAPGRGSS
ncbi:hypothetical protein ABIB83_009091 [Bradyrhizobium sp. I1.8.5]